MTAASNDEQFPYSLALILNAFFLVNYLLWAIRPPSRTLAVLLMGALVFICLAMLLRGKRLWPVFSFWVLSLLVTLWTGTPEADARGIWMCHAKRILFDNTLYAPLDSYRTCMNNAYPVLYPALAASLGRAAGLWNEVFPKSVISFLYVPPLLLICREFKNTFEATFFLGAIMLLCNIKLFNGYADAILAVYSAAVLFLALNTSIENPRKIPLLFALLSTSLAIMFLLKNEGMVQAMVIIGVMFFLKNENWKIYLPGLAFAAAFYVLTWKLPLISAQVSDLGVYARSGVSWRIIERLIERLGKQNEVLAILWAMLKEGALFPVLLTGVMIFFRSSCSVKVKKECLAAMCFVGLYSGVLFAVNLSTPLGLDYHLNTTVERVMLPVNIVSLAMLLKVLFNDRDNLGAQPGKS